MDSNEFASCGETLPFQHSPNRLKNSVSKCQVVGRREFVASAIGSALLLNARPNWAAEDAVTKPKICTFIKFVQAWDYRELAEKIAAAGYDGIEATIRQGGYIEPEDAADELPKLDEVLKQHGLEITIMTSDIVSVDSPHAESQLRTAASLGVPQYRMGYYRYDLKKPVLAQLDEIRPAMKELAAMNREMGIQAIFQNHSGASFVGAPIWDIVRLLDGISAEEVGVAFDICHASIEGGLTWPLHFDIIRPRLAAIYAKDFRWSGRKVEHVPLGAGQVDPKFFSLVRQSSFPGPYSLHVEYLEESSAEENYDAMVRDVKQLRKWIKA